MERLSTCRESSSLESPSKELLRNGNSGSDGSCGGGGSNHGSGLRHSNKVRKNGQDVRCSQLLTDKFHRGQSFSLRVSMSIVLPSFFLSVSVSIFVCLCLSTVCLFVFISLYVSLFVRLSFLVSVYLSVLSPLGSKARRALDASSVVKVAYGHFRSEQLLYIIMIL